MKRSILLTSAVAFLMTIGMVSASEFHRIKFAKGQSSANVNAQLSNMHESRCFIFWAQQNQNLSLSVSETSSNTENPTLAVYLYTPLNKGGDRIGNLKDEPVTQTGDYKVCVSESSHGREGKIKFGVTITIK